jgi:hypothetical protein
LKLNQEISKMKRNYLEEHLDEEEKWAAEQAERWDDDILFSIEETLPRVAFDGREILGQIHDHVVVALMKEEKQCGPLNESDTAEVIGNTILECIGNHWSPIKEPDPKELKKALRARLRAQERRDREEEDAA